MAQPTADAANSPPFHHQVMRVVLLIVAGGVLLIRAGGPLPPLWPVGFDHAEYMTAAWSVVHQQDAGYPLFRPPFYPALLGFLGEIAGYGRAGMVLSVGGVLVALVSALWIGGLWAGPLAAGLAALLVGLAPFTAESLFWTSPYPLLAGAVGLFTAAMATWIKGQGGILAPLVGGLALAAAVAMDGRGWILLPTLVLTPLFLPPGRPRLLPLVVALIPLMGVPVLESTLAVVERPPLTELLREQQHRALGEIRSRRDPALRACMGEVPPPSLASLTHPCTWALLKQGASTTRQILPLGLGGVVLGVVLVVGSAAPGMSLLWLSLPGWLGLLLSSLWVAAPARYLLPWQIPLLVLLPVGTIWLLRRHLSETAQVVVTGGVAVGLLMGQWSPAPTPAGEDEVYHFAGAFTTQLRGKLKPGDLLLDCTGRSLEVYLLPDIYHGPPANLQGTDQARCLRWLDLRDPLPRRILLGGEGPLSDQVGQGWILEQEAIWQGHSLQLWKTASIL